MDTADAFGDQIIDALVQLADLVTWHHHDDRPLSAWPAGYHHLACRNWTINQ
jgi:hypothetical protein